MVTTPTVDFKNIRQWCGSQHQAFEELCYQLRDPTPEGAKLVKTGNPDGGLEWYVTFHNGVQRGWQAKYSFNIDSLLQGMEKSLKTIVEGRSNCRRLTFCIPFDLPDAVESGKHKSARQKFEDKKTSWRNRIPGADRVRIELWSAGDILERLVRHPDQRGIARFFWDKEIFSPEWCDRRMQVTHKQAGRRYTPELHVDLPVSFALEGLAMSEVYWQRLRDVRDSVVRALERIQVSSYRSLGITNQLRQLNKELAKWQRAIPEKITLPKCLKQSELLTLTHDCMKLIHDTDLPQPRREQNILRQQQRITEERIRSLDFYLRQLNYALSEFESLLSSHASKAAANGALLLKGEAGQGKTHLFCDVGNRAVEAGQPAVVILCGALSGRHVWSEIAQQLGLGSVGSEEIVSAMQAAAEASNAPFLLLLDALNEVPDPRVWQEELPRLLAEVAPNPWISIAVSVRSTFLSMVLPDDGLNNVVEVKHPGFDGQELEATERFFDAFGLEQPRIPLLTPEFTNPLFLKLYCESLHGIEPSTSPLGKAYLSQTFEQYMKLKERKIAQYLRMDPELCPVQVVIDKFCNRLAEVKRDSLPYPDASCLIDAFGNGSRQWPDTLFGQLLSEGILSKDMAWDANAKKQSQVVRFTYQQFADYQVASILLDPFGSDADSLQKALFPGKRLRQTILDAPPNWLEALAVLVPERFGIELQDAAQWEHNSYIQQSWDMAFVESIKIRQPSATTERTRELLAEVLNRDPDLENLILEARLSVATQPQHRLNAYSLHKLLKAMSMSDRDVVWSIPTYYTLDEGGPLDRLIRWAARSRRPDCPREVVELAAITLAWTFTSPNRRLRDYATKALSQLLSTHLPVLQTLIPRFAGVNDPYVIERLAVVCHGAVLCGGTSNPQAVVNAADELRRVVFADNQVPNILTRDAVRGVYEWCLRNEWVDEITYATILPPYSSARPQEPLTREQISQDYDSSRALPHSYSSLMGSIFKMGDFGIYVIRPTIHNFILYPLDDVLPTEELQNRFDTVWAQRWIFQRVISLGWQPQHFAEFDHLLNHYSVDSRTDHKPERFGKKYQWIAFYELIARVTDNFHMMPEYGEESATYEGPWQLLSSDRDIDPTLPPPLRKKSIEDEVEVGPTFPQDSSHWWVPHGPGYSENDPHIRDNWGTEKHDIPEFKPLVRYKDGNKNKWVVLRAEHTWINEMSSNCSRQREFWSRIESWIIRPRQRDRVVDHLEQSTLMNKQIPEAIKQADAAYLGELPWALSCDAPENPWRSVQSYRDEGSQEVLPAWGEYLWEDNIKDCSIEDMVEAWYPALVLFDVGTLTWLPGTREWRDSGGTSVAQFIKTKGHRVLLVREDWLQQTLRKAGLAMIFRWIGEKRLFKNNANIVGDWLEINAVASLEGQSWAFGERQLKTRNVGLQ